MRVLHTDSRLDPADLVAGTLTDSLRNITYQASTKLTAGDAKLIAEVAQTENLLSFAIEWLRVFPQLRKKYRKLVKLHDNLVNFEPERAIQEGVVTYNDPIEETVIPETMIAKLRTFHRDLCPPFRGDDPSMPGSVVHLDVEDTSEDLLTPALLRA